MTFAQIFAPNYSLDANFWKSEPVYRVEFTDFIENRECMMTSVGGNALQVTQVM